MTRIFVCAMCKEEFEIDWSEADALAELHEIWDDNVSPGDCEQVCGDHMRIAQ